ncbi:patellin-2-like [Miscanthus floridulus]|uniref:patellin-2-like n=1 Tax=Miscanthus floridulus TaxID=154761 RepID=UPI00345A42C6
MDAEAPEQQAGRSYVRATTEVPAAQTTKVLEQQEGITVEQHTEGASGHQAERHPVVEEQESSHQADQAAAPRGSGRHRRFKKFNRKTKPATPRPVTLVEQMPTAPIRESPSARQTKDGPAAAAGGPSDGESLAHMTGASTTATEAMTENIDTLEAETLADVDVPAAKETTPSMVEEQLAPPAAMPGVVGATVRPQSPPMVPQATTEEDKEEVVIVEEENTTREIKRLKSAVARVMTQIEGIARTAEQRHQLMKRMEPLAEENKKLREALDLLEKSIKRAQRERDLAESNSWDLAHQKGVLSEQLTAASEQLKKKSEQLSKTQNSASFARTSSKFDKRKRKSQSEQTNWPKN